jgi:hypothetical protein
VDKHNITHRASNTRLPTVGVCSACWLRHGRFGSLVEMTEEGVRRKLREDDAFRALVWSCGLSCLSNFAFQRVALMPPWIADRDVLEQVACASARVT